MEIKECKSTNIIYEEIKQKLTEIMHKVKSNYKKDLAVYSSWYSGCSLGEKEFDELKLFGRIILQSSPIYKDLVNVDFTDRNLKITIIDSSLYDIVKEEFIKFTELNKDNIKSLCFIKDFKENV